MSRTTASTCIPVRRQGGKERSDSRRIGRLSTPRFSGPDDRFPRPPSRATYSAVPETKRRRTGTTGSSNPRVVNTQVASRRSARATVGRWSSAGRLHAYTASIATRPSASAGSGFAPAHLIGERQHISPPDANRPVDRLVSDLLCCRSRSVSGIDIDGDDATASLRKRPRDRQTVSDADFHEAVVFREFVDQRAT